MSSNISITSDGTASGTQVLVGDIPMSGVTKVEIDQIVPFGLVRATITVEGVALGISKLSLEGDGDAGADPTP